MSVVMKIVLNASPLILLCNAELDFILPALFQDIVVPNAVWQEIMVGSDRSTQQLPTLSWLTRVNVSPVTDVVQWDLGAGETAVLSFASREKAYTAVLDDLQAKKCAQSLSISAIGTGTILILAKEKQLIKSVGTALEQLRQSGLWISTPVINLLKQQAGEDI